MAKSKGGLGRGLDILFEDSTPSIGSDGKVESLPLREIAPDPEQPRKNFDEEGLAELATSLAEHGMLQPILVRPNTLGDGYIIIAGERRWRASRMAGLTEIPVVVKDVAEQEAMELALIENLQRENLDPMEESFGIKELMERCKLTQEVVAARLGKSRSAVANSLRLLNLPEQARELLRQGFISAGHAKVVLGLPTEELQIQAAQTIADNDLNVRQAEILCKKLAKEAGTEKPKKTENFKPAFPQEVEISLKEVIGNEVSVKYKEGKGSLTVSFYSDEQLSAFANLLGKYDKTGEG